MIDGEKRIVTFMGDAGKKTASIIWRGGWNLFEVVCEDTQHKESIFFADESDAQAYAEEFVWEEKYGII
jgi:hypothetical protein